MSSSDPLQSPEAFLAIADQFRLGELPTEQPHPHSQSLSDLAKKNISQAIDCCKGIDLTALEILKRSSDRITELSKDIQSTWKSGGKIFLCGCGATGRLSLTLEVIARESYAKNAGENKVIAFMAGGDAALIRSIEKFEDFPDFGKRQLEELGFTSKDRLIAITEGGETAFVIGTANRATESQWNPWFVYCNPDNILKSVATRSKEIIENPAIKKLNLSVGPMTLSGSTRMQASTVQLFAIGLALELANDEFSNSIEKRIIQFLELFNSLDLSFLPSIIEAETTAYFQGNFVLYRTDHYGITVLTDTTERSPTFSLFPFENFSNPQDSPSLCYLNLSNTSNSLSAWEKLLHRSPRTLDWDGFKHLTSLDRLLGFDISDKGIEKRTSRCKDSKQFSYDVYGDSVILEFAGIRKDLELSDQPLLFKHLLLKLILNTQSTIVMGRLNRYEGNLMTYVRPSNLKLIDRAARYIVILFEQRNPTKVLSYQDAVRAVFAVKAKMDSGQISTDSPTVLEALKNF